MQIITAFMVTYGGNNISYDRCEIKYEIRVKCQFSCGTKTYAVNKMDANKTKRVPGKYCDLQGRFPTDNVNNGV